MSHATAQAITFIRINSTCLSFGMLGVPSLVAIWISAPIFGLKCGAYIRQHQTNNDCKVEQASIERALDVLKNSVNR